MTTERKKRLSSKEKHEKAAAEAIFRMQELHDKYQADPNEDNRRVYFENLKVWGGALLQENAQLREALEFYANKKTYQITGEKFYIGHGDFVEKSYFPIEEDRGVKARQALKGESECLKHINPLYPHG